MEAFNVRDELPAADALESASYLLDQARGVLEKIADDASGAGAQACARALALEFLLESAQALVHHARDKAPAAQEVTA